MPSTSLTCGGTFSGGQVVDVRPVAEEEQVAVLEGAAAFFFLVGDGFAGMLPFL